jgi:predicted GNAT family N-acyltransferase
MDAPAAQPDAHLHARLAMSEADRALAARLRYDVYIAEQGKPYADADHATRTWTDDLDAGSVIVLVEKNGLCVGTVRASWFDSPAVMRRYGSTFSLSAFARTPAERIAVCSRLAVMPDERNSMVRNLLFCNVYEVGLARCTRLCFATCTRALLRMFRSYGFRDRPELILDPHVGPLYSLMLDLQDLAWLQAVHSPFFEIARTGICAAPTIPA